MAQEHPNQLKSTQWAVLHCSVLRITACVYPISLRHLTLWVSASGSPGHTPPKPGSISSPAHLLGEYRTSYAIITGLALLADTLPRARPNPTIPPGVETTNAWDGTASTANNSKRAAAPMLVPGRVGLDVHREKVCMIMLLCPMGLPRDECRLGLQNTALRPFSRRSISLLLSRSKLPSSPVQCRSSCLGW